MPSPRRHQGAGRPSVLRAAVRRHLEALNARALEPLLAFYAETAVLELPASPPMEGRAAIRKAFEAFFSQWEEQSTYDRVVIEGATAAVEGVTTGRHRTLHLRIPGRLATGSPQYRHRFAAFIEFAGGRIVRHRVYFDARELVRQLLG
jgi:ketosteroid isomerase-like protein